MTNLASESSLLARWPLILRYGGWILCTLPMIVGGQPRPGADSPNPAQGPTQGPVLAQQGSGNSVPGDMKHPHPYGPMRSAREDEWIQAEQFFKEHAPTYLAKVEKLSLPENRLRQLHAAMVTRYETLQRLSEHFPELFTVRVKQLELFDTLFATHEQYAGAGAAEKERLGAQMKQEISELFANSLKDRQTRINRIQEMLGKLQTSVEQDTHHEQELVDAHFKKVLEKGLDPSLLDGLVKDDADNPSPAPERVPRRNRPATTPAIP